METRITDVYAYNAGEDRRIVHHLRVKDLDTGEERLVVPTQLDEDDPEDIDIDDELAYKVSLFQNTNLENESTYIY